MQCCEFEMVLAYLRVRISEVELDRHYHRPELADILMDRGATTIDRLPDVDAIVSNLQGHMRSVA